MVNGKMHDGPADRRDVKIGVPDAEIANSQNAPKQPANQRRAVSAGEIEG
jgi:hypothetical protein